MKHFPLSFFIYLFISLVFFSAIFIFVLVDLKLDVDDAFISFRFAHNLSEGYGFCFNPGGERVEGFSNFLWVVFLGFNILCGLEVVAASLIWGIIFSFFSVVLFLKISKLYFKEKKYFWLPSLLLSLNFGFLFYALSGMETTFYLFLILLSFYFFLKEEETAEKGEEKYKLFYPSNIFFLLVSFTRPEGIIFFIAAVCYKFFHKKSLPEKLFKRLVQFAAVYLIYLIWKWFYFGDIFPTAYYVKIANHTISFKNRIIFGLVYILVFFKENPFFFFLLFFALLLFFKRRHKETLLAWLFLSIQFFFIIYSGGDEFHFKHWRFFIPMLPFFLLLLGELFLFVFHLLKARIIRFTFIVSVLFIYFALVDYSLFNTRHARNCWKFFKRYPQEIPEAISNNLSCNYINMDKAIGEWLKENYPAHTLLASGQAGQVPFYSNLEFIDLVGLTHKELALAKHKKKEFFKILKEINPDIILFFRRDLKFYENFLKAHNYCLEKFFIWEGSLDEFSAMLLFTKKSIEKTSNDFFIFGHKKYFIKKEDVMIFKDNKEQHAW